MRPGATASGLGHRDGREEMRDDGDISSATRPVVGAKISVPRLPAALVRDRLASTLEQLWQRRLGLVVAPAGSGKTTLLSQFAATSTAPVAWYQAEASEADVVSLLGHLRAALETAVSPLAGDWATVEGAARALEGISVERVVLVVDDLHALQGTPGEATLERFWTLAPPTLVLVAGSRRQPDFNLPRLRLAGSVVEIGPDDLRFRAWEVERLFRDHFGQPLAPEELAQLTRRTGGWAAGLTMFHLATRGRPAAQRLRVLNELSGSARLAREYLTRNVLDELPDALREFLVATSVLGRLSGPLCDALLGRSGSESLLEEAHARRLFTQALDDGTYRCHEVLRTFMEGLLVERRGEAAVRAAARRASALLEDQGFVPEALRASCRGDDWHGVARLLGLWGEEAIAEPGEWQESLPSSLLADDPWLLLAAARRAVARGDLDRAADAYHRAERAFGAQSAAETCRRERRILAAWTDPTFVRDSGWLGLVRAATVRQPLEAAARAADVADGNRRVAQGLALLCAGHMTVAGSLLRGVAEDPSAGPLLAAGARVAAAVVDALLEDKPAKPELAWAATTLEEAGFGWFAGVAHALLLQPDVAAGELARLRTASLAQPNRWYAALSGLLQGLLELGGGGHPVELLTEVAAELAELGAASLQAWATAGRALALHRTGAPGAVEAAASAERAARGAGVNGALVLARMAVTDADPGHRSDHDAVTHALADSAGLNLRRWEAPAPAPLPDIPIPLRVRCFGGFRIEIGGKAVDCTQVKPRARSLLRMLAVHAGQPMHRETIIDALWPDLDPAAGVRNLQVALSSVRTLLEPGVARGASSLVVREGDAYRLVVPAGADVDVVRFERALATGRAARVAGRRVETVAALEAALALHVAELYPEEGPSDWVVKRREHYRMEAADAAHALAELHLSASAPEEAIAACETGLRIDPYRDGLWRLLVEACRRTGDPAAAARAKTGYRAMLRDLGISDEGG